MTGSGDRIGSAWAGGTRDPSGLINVRCRLTTAMSGYGALQPGPGSGESHDFNPPMFWAPAVWQNSGVRAAWSEL